LSPHHLQIGDAFQRVGELQVVIAGITEYFRLQVSLQVEGISSHPHFRDHGCHFLDGYEKQRLNFTGFFKSQDVSLIPNLKE